MTKKVSPTLQHRLYVAPLPWAASHPTICTHLPGNVIYPGEGYEDEEYEEEYYEDEALEESGGKKRAKKAKKLLRKLNVAKIGKHIGRCRMLYIG
jgi:hypothetical protein